jgi:DNA-binding PadR family transcriptional regulator
MKKTKLGEFEEFVLLTVAALQDEAYGVEIKREMERRMKQRLSVGSVQSALKRLEDKGFLKSQLGEATQKRGGKRKRIYTITKYAEKVLIELKELRVGLWESIPQLTFNMQ